MGSFIGKGYSKEFTENMTSVISALENGENFVLKNGADDICRACPYNIDGICKDTDKVNLYDKEVKDALMLEYGKEYVYESVKEAVNLRIYGKGKLKEICGDCEWAQICFEIIQYNKRNFKKGLDNSGFI